MIQKLGKHVHVCIRQYFHNALEVGVELTFHSLRKGNSDNLSLPMQLAGWWFLSLCALLLLLSTSVLHAEALTERVVRDAYILILNSYSMLNPKSFIVKRAHWNSLCSSDRENGYNYEDPRCWVLWDILSNRYDNVMDKMTAIVYDMSSGLSKIWNITHRLLGNPWTLWNYILSHAYFVFSARLRAVYWSWKV